MGPTNQPLPLLPLFSSFMAASKSNRRQTASKKKFAAGTLEQYQCVYKLLAAYELKYHLTLRLELVKKHSITAIQKQKRYWSCFFKTFCRFLYSDKGCLDTYVAAVFKVLKTFFNYLSKDKHLPIGSFHHLFRSPAPTYTPLVLEPCQLQFLIQDLPFDQT